MGSEMCIRDRFKTATNMTDELAALIILERLGGQRVNMAMDEFFEKWSHNPIVIDKWFSVQAMRHYPDGIDGLKVLISHSAFDPNNPNRVRAVLGSFAMSNPLLFHKSDGTGYRFFSDQVLDMDKRNPSVAARLLGVYEIWPKLDTERQALIRAELRRILAAKPSKNTTEIATKTLG